MNIIWKRSHASDEETPLSHGHQVPGTPNGLVGGAGGNDMKSVSRTLARFFLEIFFPRGRPRFGRTHLLGYLRKYQLSAFLPITSKKRLCLDLGVHVRASRVGRSSERRSQGVWIHRHSRDSDNWLQVLNPQQKCAPLVLVILRENSLEHRAILLLL